MFRPTRRTLHAVLALVVLWTAAATTQATPPADPSVDARQRLELPAPLRDKARSEKAASGATPRGENPWKAFGRRSAMRGRWQ